MLKLLDKNAPIDWPVTVQVPVSGGKTQEQKFTAKFQLSKHDTQGLGKMGNTAFLKAVVVGWEGITDANNAPVPFNETNLELIATYDFIALGIVEAYFAFAMGRAEKNSEEPSGT